MSYPTFLPTDQLTKMHERRFGELTANTPLPSDPLHVEVESRKFEDLLQKTTLPSDEARTHLETSRFESLIADAPLPSQQFLEQNAPPEPAAISPSVPAPDGVFGGPSGASDDPIAKTLAFLRGLAPGGAEAPQTSADAPQTVRVPGTGLDQPANPDVLGGLGAAAQFPAQVLRAGAAPTAPTSGLDTVTDLATQGPFGAIPRGIERIATHGLEQSQAPYNQVRSDLVANDPTGGIASGAVNAGLALGTDPLVLAGGVGGLGGRVGVGTTIAGGLGGAGYSLATGADPTQTAANVEMGAGLGAMAGIPASLAAPAVGRAISRAAPVVREGVEQLGTAAREMGAAATEAGIVPGATIKDVGGFGDGMVTPEGEARWAAIQAKIRAGETPPGGASVPAAADVGGAPPRQSLEPPPANRLADALDDAPPHPGPQPGEDDWSALMGPAEKGGPPTAARPLKATLEQPMQPDVVLPGHQISTTRKLWDRSRNIIAGMGDAGAELANRVHQWRDDWQVDAARAIKEMPTVKTLSKTEMTNLVDVLERGKVGLAKNAVAANDKVARAAVEVRAVLDDAFARAQNAGVDVAAPIETGYFPHVFARETIEAMKREDVQRAARKHLIDSGQAADEVEATGIMHRFLQGGERDRRNGNLEMARTANMPGYEKTKEALYNHVADAYKRLHEVAQFGPDDAIANRLLDRIGKQGDDLATARDMFQIIVGAKTYDDMFKGASRVARLYNSTTRLGLSVLSNATQIGNTASVIGVVRAMQAAKGAAWSRAEKAYVDTTGVTLDAILRELREGGGWSDKVAGVVRPGFNEVEIWNRRTAAIGGRDFARDMAARAAGTATGLNRIGFKSGARRALTKMGLDADEIVKRGGTLTPEEEIRAGRSMVERTQFYVDPQDLPGWTQHPIGKMVAQFRTFGYQQTAFVFREAIDEAKAGNVGPIVRLLVIEPMLGAVATETNNALTGRPPEEDPVKRIAQYGTAPLGLMGNAARMVLPINGQYIPADRRATMAIGQVLGPTAGTASDLIAAGYNLGDAAFRTTNPSGTPRSDESRVDQLKSVGRTALRQVPVLGQLTVNRAFPYKAPASTAGRSGRSDTSRSSDRSDTSRTDRRR